MKPIYYLRSLAISIRELDRLLKQQKRESKIRKEVEEFTARILRLTKQLQEMKMEMTRMDILHIEKEIAALQVKSKQHQMLLPVSNMKERWRIVSDKKNNASHFNKRLNVFALRLRIASPDSENMRFAHANQKFSSGESAESINFYMNMAANHADNTYETSEAYQKLIYD